ncbi:Tetratricopeptide TPR_2 repeat-containing protein [Clostridium sp. DL-VIII]|uniref:helix-turn-helix transcriptional regulator n=1 Tax=Clostridium sp. DL-VIII TaxID=641107 RepID=UPI00023B0354|nr:helix-turn-helix transcriptional regulator [Clostridium sp. DL-VIII]EHJ01817.1 Tetratricopeptide TPR_2 repeat-containing protein [Clostridium sp. DL-VIII]
MEILSTGEKIKRARIFKGITLKELCEDKISIAKMSCIENGKIKADKELLKYIAKKIEIDLEYLIEDVYEQISNNLKIMKKNVSCDTDSENKLRDNLNYALKYKYYDLAFDLIHILFSYYVEENKVENIQLIVSQYYDLYQRDNTEENTIIYFKDMARYLSQNGEYIEAISYYSKLREMFEQKKEMVISEYCLISYNEALCYQNLNKLDEAYAILSGIIEYVDNLKSDESKGKIYHIYAAICIKLKKDCVDKYKKKAFEYQKYNPILLALSHGNYGRYYFEVGEKEKAIREIEEGIKIFPRDNIEKNVEFLNYCTGILIDDSEYEIACKITEESLNKAIITNNIKLIEKSYYLKGIILQKMDRYLEAEKYMNLSLDSLFKFGTREERKNRYMDMGKLYYKLGSTTDSLKYFNLAFSVDKKI